MKITANTLAILKNFSQINQGILIREGKKISTMSVSKQVIAQADVDVEFPKEFAIYDLNEFLSTISLFDDPDFEFNDNDVVIKQGNASVKYYYSSNSIVIAAPEQVNFPEPTINFKFNNSDVQSLSKASNILSLDYLKFKSDGDKILCELQDSSNTSSNSYFVEVDGDGVEFETEIKMENINILPGDYDVGVSEDSFVSFKGEGVKYWVAAEQ